MKVKEIRLKRTIHPLSLQK